MKRIKLNRSQNRSKIGYASLKMVSRCREAYLLSIQNGRFFVRMIENIRSHPDLVFTRGATVDQIMEALMRAQS
jgi:hypothetical protein